MIRPLAQALKDHWRKILLGCGLLAATNALFYISIAGVLSYGTTELGLKRNSLLIISLLSALLTVGVVLWSGKMSDKIGRRPMILIGAAAIVITGRDAPAPLVELADTVTEMVQWVFPEHAGAPGQIHGGRMMQWIATVGNMAAARVAVMRVRSSVCS